MKKNKVFLTVLLAVCALLCVFGLSACAGGDLGNNGVGSNSESIAIDGDIGNNGGSGSNENNGGNNTGETGGGNNPPATHTHSYVDTVVAPTCVDKGYTLHKCSCGDEYKDGYINATGTHTFEDCICKYCGQIDPNEPRTAGLEYIAIKQFGEIVGYNVKKGNAEGSNIIIPHCNEGKPVLQIAQDAFRDCDNLKSIEIPNSVESIGSHAFSGCSSLTSIEIPNSVTSIGWYAFSGCKSLTSIEIPNSVTSIGWSTFYFCSGLTSVTFAENSKLASIGSDAFNGCSGLTSIEIPNSVTSIGSQAFAQCSGLTSVEIPNSVTSIGDRAFHDCSSLTSIEIPNSVTSIGDNAFSGCSSLTIYCEATSKPSGWDSGWNYSNCPVVWGKRGG